MEQKGWCRVVERLTERKNVIDILEKFQFFQGQRAGRELWNDKPKNVQEEDLENFNRDIRTIRDYIWDLEHELKSYKDADEQGLLLRLPCKVGDTVYVVGTKCLADQEPNDEWCEANICDDCIYDREYVVFERNVTLWLLSDLAFGSDVLYKMNKTVFLTKEEAEQALAEMERKNG